MFGFEVNEINTCLEYLQERGHFVETHSIKLHIDTSVNIRPGNRENMRFLRLTFNTIS